MSTRYKIVLSLLLVSMLLAAIVMVVMRRHVEPTAAETSTKYASLFTYFPTYYAGFEQKLMPKKHAAEQCETDVKNLKAGVVSSDCNKLWHDTYKTALTMSELCESNKPWESNGIDSLMDVAVKQVHVDSEDNIPTPKLDASKSILDYDPNARYGPRAAIMIRGIGSCFEYHVQRWQQTGSVN